MMPKLESFIELSILRNAFLGFAALAFLLAPLRVFGQVGATPIQGSISSTLQNHSAELSLEPLTSYEIDFKRGALFGAYELRSHRSGVVPSRTSLATRVKDYRLKGVIDTDEPEAILEDARTQKTFFVQQGDFVGEMKVQQISESTVFLEHLGQTHELKIGGGL